MDTTTREQDIVKQVIQRYAQFKPSHGDSCISVYCLMIFTLQSSRDGLIVGFKPFSAFLALYKDLDKFIL